jgi:hypothetical protein
VNEKPHKLDMGFGEALARLARVPKSAVDGKNTPKAKSRKEAAPAKLDKGRIHRAK